MPKLIWDEPGTREYEIGVDRGVLYPESTYGVAWPGLTTVTEKPSGGEPRVYYRDGKKYQTEVATTEFAATIETISTPKEFRINDGIDELSIGLLQTHQKRQPFAFSYRTRVGDDVNGHNGAYKIHIVYNATALPSERNYNTKTNDVELTTLSYDIQAVAPMLDGVSPTAHVVLDSRKVPEALFAAVEQLLYGDETIPPQLVAPDTLFNAVMSQPYSHTNAWLNPSFENPASGAGIVVQTNYHLNPQAATFDNYSSWAGTNNVSHSGLVTDAAWSKSGKSIRSKWDTVVSPNSGDISIQWGASATAAGLAAGTKVTVIFSYIASRAGLTVAAPVLYYGGASQTVLARSRTTPYSPAVGEVVTDWITFTLPASWAASDRMVCSVSNLQVNDYFEMSMGNMYLGDYDPEKTWFSGTITSDAAMVPSWAGTGNASRSILTGYAPSDTSPSHTVNVQSSNWHGKKLKSVRVIPDGSTTDTFVTLNNIMFVPGYFYTFVATLRLERAQVNQIANRPRKIVFFYKASGSSLYTEVGSAQPPNVPGVYEVRLKLLVPTGSSGFIVRLYNGSDKGSVWWDDCLIIQENYDGPYFDGDTVSESRWISYDWQGPVDHSPSVKHDWIPAAELKMPYGQGPYGQYPYGG